MPFSFDNIITPQSEKLQQTFSSLWAQLSSLGDSIPDDRVELMKEKEEWCHSWERVMRDLDQCAIDGKTYGLSFPLSSDEAAKGHAGSDHFDFFRAQLRAERMEAERRLAERAEEDRRREEALAKDEDTRMSLGADDERTAEEEEASKGDSGENEVEEEEEEEENGEDEEEEEELPKCAPPKKAAAPAKQKTPQMSTTPALIVHKDRCKRCIKQDVRCQGPEGMGCQNCRSARQGCKFSTRKGKCRAIKPLPRPKARTASTAESMPFAGPSKEVLIRRPRTTIEPSDEEEGAATRPTAGNKRGEVEALGDVEDVDAEDLEIEALTRSVYAQMATIQAMMGKVLNDVDLLNLRNKKWCHRA
ncbi:hypothetical protein C8R48DRAFT_772958 [Suillus tomentosus]|nr:hypothetical protein C8R48DRAFT_782540 [Suillus tomentosus]KAG1865256.1 hypothetical protein C8R48DRAFT_772958 [Suillus tomentosus]